MDIIYAFFGTLAVIATWGSLLYFVLKRMFTDRDFIIRKI